MCFKNTNQNFGLISKGFHWGIALLILGLLVMGYYMVGLTASPFMFTLYGLHKSFGILVFGLVVLRLLWRIASIPPDALLSHKPWEKHLSKLVKLVLYASMIGMPLSGLVMSFSGGYPVRFFGVELPTLIGKDEDLSELMELVHLYVSYAFLISLFLHVLGALKHHFIDKDKTLKRMSGSIVGFKIACLIGGVSLLLLTVSSVLAFWPYLAKTEKDVEHPAHEQSVVEDNDFEYKEDLVEEEVHSDSLYVHEANIDEAGRKVVANSYSEHWNIDALNIWDIDYEQSVISFEAIQHDKSFNGAFENFQGRIIFDPENLQESSAEIEIDIASIKTGNDDRDNEAAGMDWFETSVFPKAYFKSTSFERIDANRYVVNAQLTIRDVEIPVKMPFSLHIEKEDRGVDLAEMEGNLIVNRLNFGIGKGRWDTGETIGNLVKIKISVRAYLNNLAD